jgi:uncharacterized protein (UPF0276 family)
MAGLSNLKLLDELLEPYRALQGHARTMLSKCRICVMFPVSCHGLPRIATDQAVDAAGAGCSAKVEVRRFGTFRRSARLPWCGRSGMNNWNTLLKIAIYS